MTGRTRENILLVEGKEDLLVIAELLERSGSSWQLGAEPIHIEVAGSIGEILRPGFIPATLKSSQLRVCGILVDADTDVAARWQAIRNLLVPTHPTIPLSLPPEGLIHDESGGLPRVGVWIMPDNLSHGMLESMLLAMRASNSALDTYICEALDMARSHGANWKDVHRPKAELHTWLSWQDPPGCQMHIAVRKGWLQPALLNSTFVKWAQTLFHLS